MKVVEEEHHFVKTGEHGELALERVLSEEQIEHGVVVLFAALPVGVRHGDLVEICGDDWRLEGYT